MQKPETTFIQSVHRHLPRDVYFEKMSNMYRGGTPDVYYDGVHDLWVEYKFIPKVAARVVPNLSALQQKWLQRAHTNLRRVFVIVGCKAGGVVYHNPDEWTAGLHGDEFARRLLPRPALAEWLTQQIRHGTCSST